jgi:outer membrane protein TolC
MRKSIASLLIVALSGMCVFGEDNPSAPFAPMTLDGAIKSGMKTYEPLKLADEEVELARLRRQEAYRALYPAMSIKAEQTKGETADVLVSPDFTQRNYGAALTYDVIGGGKLISTYRQSEASYTAATLSREKTYQDYLYNVQESYWSMAAAQAKLKDLESTRDEIKDELKKVTEQYVLDVAVKQQFLAVKGQYLQANTQVNNAQKDYVSAKWDMAKALGLPAQPKDPVDANIPYKKIEMDLNSCLALAAAHRPDLKMQEYLVEISKQGLSVANAYTKPKVSLNGFYGRSAAAYDGDPLEYREDWQINATLSQSFMGSSLGLNGSDIKTSPQLGQSTRTRVKTEGASLNILDNVKNKTDYKQADLSYRQAALKRDDLKKDVARDVELSFYNVNQAILKVDYSAEDMSLAEEELRVVQSKGRYGLAGVLEVAQAKNRLSASRAARLDALAAYQVAVAAMNRAVGVPDQFKAE